jgi:hypothetical protein
MNELISYSMILQEFGELKVKQRYEFLHEKINNYIKAKKIEEKVYINTELLQQVVLDYFTDIYRLKKFHGIDKINVTKIISYEVYWLLRRKPIQIRENTENDLKFVNENFLTVFLAHEFLFSDIEVATDAGEKIFFDYLKHVSYHLKYRMVDKQNIEIMLLSFETGKQLYRDTVNDIVQETI